MNTATKNTIDITDMTDNVLDVVLEARSGAEVVDCEHLTPKERFQVAEALGWEMSAATRYWIDGSGFAKKDAKPALHPGADYEALILEEQEEFFS